MSELAGKIYKIAFELAAKLEGSYDAAMTRTLHDLTEVERRARDLNAIRVSGDMVNPLRDGLRDLEREMRGIRTAPVPAGIFTSMNTELRAAATDAKSLLQTLRQIGQFRMPGNLFGNDMRDYIRDIERLERQMRNIQGMGGPSGGGAGGGGHGGAGGVGGKSLIGAGALIAGGGVALVGGAALAGGAVFSFSNDYQTAMAQIKASTGASEDQMKDFSKIAESLYNQSLGESWYDLAEAVGTVRQVTKLSGADLEKTTRNAIAYRDTFGEDVTESIKAADTMMRNFGITSDQAFNLMAQGAQQGLNKSGELLDSANEYAPHFAKLGFTGDQMFDTFSAGLEAGAFNLDKVGDAIKEFNIRSKDMSATSVESYKMLGLNAEKMSQTFAKGGSAAQKAFEDIVASISAIEDPVKKNTIGVGLFGTQFEDLEADVVKAMGVAQSRFDSAKKSMDALAKVKYDTLGKAFQGIGRNLQTGIILPMTKALLPVAQRFSDWLTDKLPAIQGVFAKIGPTIEWIADKFSGLWSGMGGDGVVSMAKGIFGEVAETAATYMDAVKEIWSDIEPHVMGVVGSIGSIFKLLIPVVFKIAGTIQQVARKIISFVMPISAYFQSKLWPILDKIFKFLATSVFPQISNIISMLLPKITSVVDKIGAAISSIWNFVKPALDDLFAAFDYVFPIIQNIVTGAFDAIGGVLSGAMDIFGGVIDFITGVFSGDWEKAWTGVKGIFTGIFDTLGAALTFPINLAIDAINAAIRGINKVSIDIPEWVPGFGGESLGFSIPEIKKIGGYADGGYVTKPELAWVGEGKSNEWIIPENNSERSRSLWRSAGESLGMRGEGGSGDINFNPIYNFYGNADKAAVQQMEAQTRRDFAQEFAAWKQQQRRVAFG